MRFTNRKIGKPCMHELYRKYVRYLRSAYRKYRKLWKREAAMHAGSLWKRGGELFWRKSPEHFTNMADREDLARCLYIAVKRAITEAVAFQQLPSPEEQVKSRYSCARYAEIKSMPSRSCSIMVSHRKSDSDFSLQNLVWCEPIIALQSCNILRTVHKRLDGQFHKVDPGDALLIPVYLVSKSRTKLPPWNTSHGLFCIEEYFIGIPELLELCLRYINRTWATYPFLTFINRIHSVAGDLYESPALVLNFLLVIYQSVFLASELQLEINESPRFSSCYLLWYKIVYRCVRYKNTWDHFCVI